VSDDVLTVLYIEDNPSNLLLVQRIFRDRADTLLLTASRGLEGLDTARSERPGLILLDLHLPDMPGVEVLRELRADPLTASIPVVAVSADATADQIKHLRGEGVVGYVTKPFEVPRLYAIVDSFRASGSGTLEGSALDLGASARATATGFPEDTVLDPVRVAELRGLDHDGTAFLSLAAAALDDAETRIAAIADDAERRGDAAAVGAAAHGLKSSAALLGARRLAAVADAVERTARAGSWPEPSVLAELRDALTATRQATLEETGT
jgi:CheY-like chemotaxis protein